eukprot:gene13200-9732_t
MFMKKSTVSIALSLLNGDFVSSQQKLYVRENNMKFDSISPILVTNSNQNIQISGNSFLNDSTIITKFYNGKMKDFMISTLTANGIVSSSVPKSFYVGNLVYPFELNVAVSFDNGISFVETNKTITIISLRKINMNPSTSTTNFSISFQLNLPDSLKQIAFKFKLKKTSNEIDLICNSEYSLCNSSQTSLVSSGIYELYIYIDSVPIHIES